ncbi:MAG: ArV1 [Polaromonas sp.]|nr:ArV1 [Polaromonas sp.]
MSTVDQTILHAEGECGNCLQASLASILDWPLEAVPHFALLGENHWWDCLLAWLDAQGFWLDYRADSFAGTGGAVLPRCLLSGPSPRGFSHAVVGDSATGQMLHDPHPSRAGLVSVAYRAYLFRKPLP